jgi:AmmeMemoRadiSam system protein A
MSTDESGSGSIPAFQVPPPPALSPEEGSLLVRLALEAIRGIWGRPAADLRGPDSGPLAHPAGAFVTIYSGESLRGCLGIISSPDPICRLVQDLAVSSATRDPRFDSITEDEYPTLSVEISVLGPLEQLPANDPSKLPDLIRVGEHGLLIRHRGMSGLLLPQVPVRYGWDSARFLEELCYKAGLSGDAWRHRSAEVSAFRCAIFKGKAGSAAAGGEA